MFRIAAALALLGALFIGPLSASAAEACSPHYEHGFAALQQLLGADMGQPLTCEFADPNGTGDVHQETTRGLAFWRKSTNTPTFTNGYDHWGLTQQGALHWIGSSIDPPGQRAAAPVAPPAPPRPAPAPAPAAPPPAPAPAPAQPTTRTDTSLQAFVSNVLADANAFWARTLRAYQPARVVWYRDSVDGACGYSSDAGPFYCAADGVVYLQTPFLEQLWRGGLNYGVAAVLGHEIGHHVQRTAGIRVADRPSRPGEVLSIHAELGADCLGGVWVGDATRRGWLPADAVDQARVITSAAGDPADTAPSDPRAHGTAAQRLAAFSTGFADRSPQECLAY